MTKNYTILNDVLADLGAATEAIDRALALPVRSSKRPDYLEGIKIILRAASLRIESY